MTRLMAADLAPKIRSTRLQWDRSPRALDIVLTDDAIRDDGERYCSSVSAKRMTSLCALPGVPGGELRHRQALRGRRRARGSEPRAQPPGPLSRSACVGPSRSRCSRLTISCRWHAGPRKQASTRSRCRTRSSSPSRCRRATRTRVTDLASGPAHQALQLGGAAFVTNRVHAAAARAPLLTNVAKPDPDPPLVSSSCRRWRCSRTTAPVSRGLAGSPSVA